MSARRPPRALAGGLFGLLCLFGAGAAPGAPERAAHPAPPAAPGAVGTPGDLPPGGSGRARTAATSPPRGAAPDGSSPSPAGCAPGERSLDPSTAPSGEPCGAGRLFSTPEERRRLDALRRRHERRQAPVAAPVVLPPARPGPERGRLALRLDGVVLRSLGTGAAWVNGERVFGAGSTREGVRVLGAEGGGVRLVLPGGGAVRLRAGQHVDLVTGMVREGRQAGGDPSGNAAASAPLAPAGPPEQWEE